MPAIVQAKVSLRRRQCACKGCCTGRQAHTQHTPAPPPRARAPQAWHPGLDDPGFGEAEQRFEVLMQALGVGQGRDPSRRLGACIRLLRAFRQGELGAYTLDEVPGGR